MACHSLCRTFLNQLVLVNCCSSSTYNVHGTTYVLGVLPWWFVSWQSLMPHSQSGQPTWARPLPHGWPRQGSHRPHRGPVVQGPAMRRDRIGNQRDSKPTRSIPFLPAPPHPARAPGTIYSSGENSHNGHESRIVRPMVFPPCWSCRCILAMGETGETITRAWRDPSVN